MISFDRIDDLMMPLEERLEAFYMRTLTDSSRSLSSLLRAKNALNPATFYPRKYLAADELYDSIVKRIAKLSGYTEEDLRQIFKRAGFESMKDEQAMIGKLGLEVPELATSDVLTGAVNAVFARTNVVLQNLTRSIAYQSEMAFIGAVDDAFLAVATGTMGIDQAVKQGVLNLAAQGIKVLNSQTGRVEQADVAIKRNVWTGINQATGDMTLAMAAEVGTDYVEVSAHPGARNKGAGPMNHASWQGKVYSISGNDPKYEALIPTTGYGTGAGLLGWNCRHSLFLHFPGFEQPNYTQSELDRMNNTQVTYNGKQMDLYEATQQQRYLERGVRDWKRKQAMFEAAGLGEEHQMAGVKIEEWQAKLRDFTKQTGLERRMEWEQVAGVKAQRPAWGKSTMPEVKAPVVKADSYVRLDNINDIENSINNKMKLINGKPNLSGIDIELANEWNKTAIDLVNKYPQLSGRMNFISTKHGTDSISTYIPLGKRIEGAGIEIDKAYFENAKTYKALVDSKVSEGFFATNNTPMHEFGHFVDDLLSRKYYPNDDFGSSYRIKKQIFSELGISNDDVIKGLSEYATWSPSEFFAEAFSEYMTSDNPRKIAKRFGEILDELIKGL